MKGYSKRMAPMLTQGIADQLAILGDSASKAALNIRSQPGDVVVAARMTVILVSMATRALKTIDQVTGTHDVTNAAMQWNRETVGDD